MARAVDSVRQTHAELEPAASARAQPAHPFIPFGLALLLITCSIWSIDVISPVLPEITDAFGLSAKSAGLIVSFLFIGRLIGNLPAVGLLERYGAPRTATFGGMLLGLGAVTNMLAPNVEALYLGRGLQGVGVALLVNAGLRSILVARPGRGAAMTQYGLASTMGSVLALVSSGVIAGNAGWRAVFVLATALGVALTLLPLVGTRVTRQTSRPVESSERTPSIAVPLRSYLIPLLMNFAIFCNYSIWVILPLYAQRRFEATPAVTANLLLVITFMHLAAAVPVSRAIGRFGSANVLVGSVVVAALGTAGIVLASSVWLLTVPLLLYGAGMVGSVNSAGDLVLFRGGAGSKAVGSLRQASDLGLVIGPIVAGAIADSFGFSAPFVVFPVLILAAALGVLLPRLSTPQRSMENA